MLPSGPELYVSRMRLRYIPMYKYSQKGSLSGMQAEEDGLGEDLCSDCMHVFPGQTPSLCS